MAAAAQEGWSRCRQLDGSCAHALLECAQLLLLMRQSQLQRIIRGLLMGRWSLAAAGWAGLCMPPLLIVVTATLAAFAGRGVAAAAFRVAAAAHAVLLPESRGS